MRRPRPGHQGQQGAQDGRRPIAQGGGQGALHAVGDPVQRHRRLGRRAQQGLEQEVLLQLLAQADAPRHAVQAVQQGRQGFLMREEGGQIGGHRLLGRGKRPSAQGRQHGPVVRQQMLDHCVADEGIETLALLGHHGIRVEAGGEHLSGIVAQGRGIARVAQGRRGADADQPRPLAPKAAAQPADQHGQVRALGPIEGVQLIDHQIAQGVRAIVSPQALIPRADHQEVEHLVVGEQEVGGVQALHLLVGDHLIRPHHRLVRYRRLPPAARPPLAAPGADEEPRADAAEGGRYMHQFGDTPGLVIGQGVHRVDDDRLDALDPPPAGPGHMVKQRVEEGLGLARARARGDQGGAPLTATQLPGQLLMAMCRELGQEVLEEAPAARALDEGQTQLHIGPLHPGRGLDQPADGILEQRGGRLELHAQRLRDATPHLLDDQGRQHR